MAARPTFNAKKKEVDRTALAADVLRDEMTSKDYFIDYYARFGSHEELLKDEVRTMTFRNSMYYNKHLFKGKIVLDVGCGTGILSMFAAKAGAARVIGIDCSNIADYAKTIIKANGYEDTVTIVKGKVEEVELPDGIEKVDIIVSDWMGYCLFSESMLETVLHARDKWLKPGGMIFPDKCDFYICAIEDRRYRNKLNWWDDVYDFDMSCLRNVAAAEPVVNVVEPKRTVTYHIKLLDINLNTMKKADAANLNIDIPFKLLSRRNGHVHALTTFFTVQFSKCLKHTWFSTAPEAPYTHWRQTVFYLEKDAIVKKGEEIDGRFELKHNPSTRDLDFSVTVDFDSEESPLHESKKFYMRR